MQNKRLWPYLMWCFPVLFFSFQFILRLWPSLLMPTIMQHYQVSASQFGVMAAMYYYGYASMQIPIALLLNRYGARVVILLSALLCGLAMLTFNLTDHWWLACLSRFAIGVGSVVGFLGTSKVIADWFPHQRYAQMVGYSFTVGLMGAIYGGKPVSLLIDQMGWQSLTLVLALVSVALGLGAYFCVKKPKDSHEEGFSFAQFKQLLSNKSLWCLAIANLLMVGTLEGFADVWGVPYLMTAHHLLKSDAALLVSFIFVGMLFGGPLLAALSRKLGNLTVIMMAGLGMSFAFTLLLQLHFHWTLFAGIFFLLGLLCCYQVIVFAAGLDMVDKSLMSVVVAFLNCVNMLGGTFFHTSIGYLMDANWSGTYLENGVRAYDLSAYLQALHIIPVCTVVGVGLLSLIVLGQRWQNRFANAR